MAELDDLDSRARLAVLEVMGWPDDRDHPGTEDGVPPAAHWTLAGELVGAVRQVQAEDEERARADRQLMRRYIDRGVEFTAESLLARLTANGHSITSNRLTIAINHCVFRGWIYVVRPGLFLFPPPDHTTTDQGGPDGSC